MIFIGIGGNLATVRHGPPLATCSAALAELARYDIVVVGRSRWYRSRPVPPSDQPAYINAVARVTTGLDPVGLLKVLHTVEARFGRRRGMPNAARPVDLDVLTYGAEIRERDSGIVLPHPRMHQRRFVLQPLAELAPCWRHPRLGLTTLQMLAQVPKCQVAEPLDEAAD